MREIVYRKKNVSTDEMEKYFELLVEAIDRKFNLMIQEQEMLRDDLEKVRKNVEELKRDNEILKISHVHLTAAVDVIRKVLIEHRNKAEIQTAKKYNQKAR